MVEVARIRVGEESLTDTRLTLLPGDTDATETLDGILGIDFLRRYAVAFSVSERLMRLYPPLNQNNFRSRNWTTVSLEPVLIGPISEPLPYLEVTVAGRTIPALFDLGAGISILNSPAASALRLQARDTNEPAELSGAIGSAPVLAQLSSQDLGTGDVFWSNETLLIADLEIFETLDSADRPLAILGSGLFNQRDFAIDLANDRLLIRRGMREQDRNSGAVSTFD